MLLSYLNALSSELLYLCWPKEHLYETDLPLCSSSHYHDWKPTRNPFLHRFDQASKRSRKQLDSR